MRVLLKQSRPSSMAAQSGFTSFQEAIGALLDKHEMRPDSTKLFVPIAKEREFPNVHDVDQFKRQAESMASEGGIEIRRIPKSGPCGPIKQFKLLDPGPLYALLGREPISNQVENTIEELMESDHGIPPDFMDLVGVAKSNWSNGRSWHGIPVNDTVTLTKLIRIADGIRRSVQGDGMDMRTFSRKVCGDSKALERNRATVLNLLNAIQFDYEKADKPEDTLRGLGIEKFLQPVMIAGPLYIDGMRISDALPYFGIPGGSIDRIDITLMRPHVKAVLTIENFASFNRQVTEVADRSVLTIYTGGFPSKSVTRLLTSLANELSENVEFLHWGDIDMAGARIADLIWRTVDRPMRLHLMDVDLAVRLGSKAAAEVMPSFSVESPSHTLARCLSRSKGNVWTLEQEELEPKSVL